MVFTIGIDPHKATHTAAVLDGSEAVVAEFRFAADVHQRDRVLSFAAQFAPRTWAIEQATGLGALLAQQLVAVGETVFDVPPTLSARVRLLDSTRTDKTDAHDARAAAIVAYAIRVCGRSRWLITVLCCDCSRTVTTIWSRCALRRCVGSMPCCANWLPAVLQGDCRPSGG